jgi:hypothetical protein
MNRTGLRKIPFKKRGYDAANALFTGDQVLDAMTAAYNKAIEDAEKSVNEYVDWWQFNFEDLKIRD